MTVPIPEEAMRLACDAYDAAVQAEYDAREAGDAVDVPALESHAEVAAVRAAAPLIVAAYLDSIGREFWSDSHISKVCRERASVLRGEGQTQ